MYPLSILPTCYFCVLFSRMNRRTPRIIHKFFLFQSLKATETHSNQSLLFEFNPIRVGNMECSSGTISESAQAKLNLVISLHLVIISLLWSLTWIFFFCFEFTY